MSRTGNELNRLQYESSPYLQQHAANPVDWYPWGEEALSRARREEKPILVSIGYSTCHWCHVMERESFEDEEIAAFMNARFVNIKVDREERPDLDQVFMEACQIITGQGGWPLNVFLTAEGRPFYAGTYFPPEPQGRRLSWSQALQYAAFNFYENRQAVERQADRIQSQLESAGPKATDPAGNFPENEPDFSKDTAGKIFDKLSGQFDHQAGGFGAPPKFPNTMALEYLLHYAWLTGEEAARDHLLFSLDQMLGGGIYDHLGGGLARYAVDRDWIVPHFEKMLYDNALLASLLADVFRWTGEVRFLHKMEEILEFTERELGAPDGGFFAALDADTKGEEGAYYTWTKGEIEAVLGKDAAVFCDFYQVTEAGNWEGRNILHAPRSVPEFAQDKNLSEKELTDLLENGRRRLFRARSERPYPHRDEKIILSWNAPMVSTYAKAFHATGKEKYREKGLHLLDFIRRNFFDRVTGRLRRIRQEGKTRQQAFLNDYAFLIEAFLQAYSLDYDPEKLTKAASLTEMVFELFSEGEHPLFLFAEKNADDLFFKNREVNDEEMPAGNAVMVANLRQLGILLDRTDWRMHAAKMLRALKENLIKNPLPVARWATEALIETYGPYEVAVIGPAAPETAARIQRHFIPGLLLMASPHANDHFPLLKGRTQKKGTLIYLCRDYVCHQPVRTVGEMMGQLGG